jgi:hypothetical protein
MCSLYVITLCKTGELRKPKPNSNGHNFICKLLNAYSTHFLFFAFLHLLAFLKTSQSLFALRSIIVAINVLFLAGEVQFKIQAHMKYVKRIGLYATNGSARVERGSDPKAGWSSHM